MSLKLVLVVLVNAKKINNNQIYESNYSARFCKLKKKKLDKEII